MFQFIFNYIVPNYNSHLKAIDSRDTVWAAACHLKTDHAQKTQIGDDHTSEDETQKQLDTF